MDIRVAEETVGVVSGFLKLQLGVVALLALDLSSVPGKSGACFSAHPTGLGVF